MNKINFINSDIVDNFENSVIVDPAGLPYIQGNPNNAGGASRNIYNKIGLINSFSYEIKNNIQSVGDVSYYLYKNNREEFRIIHAVGPNYGENTSEDKNDILLGLVYKNIFKVFTKINKNTLNLRLLPISSGIFSGNHTPDSMVKKQYNALNLAYKNLTVSQKKNISKALTDGRIFMHFLSENIICNFR